MIEHAKTNRSTHFFFYQKKNSSSLPPIKMRSLSNKKFTIKANVSDNTQSNIDVIISEIKEMMNYIKKIISRINIDDDIKATLIINETLRSKLNMIQIGLEYGIENYSHRIEAKSKNLTELYNEYNSANKDELIIALTSQIEFYKLYYKKLNDLLFSANISLYRNEMAKKCKNAKLNCEYLFTILSSFNNDFDRNENIFANNTISNFSKEINFSNDNFAYNNNFISDLNAMKTLYEFLTYDAEDENSKIICKKIKELFFADNNTIQKILFKFITDKLHIKNNIVSHLRSVLNSKDCYETLENITSIRKILEDYCDEKNKENSKLKEQIEKMQFQLQKIENENEQTKKRVDVFKNKDFKNLFTQIKNENEIFLNKIPQIAKKNIEDLLDKLQDKTEKCDELKREINKLKSEILFIKNKNDFNMRTPYKKGSDDYYEALQVQMDEMKESFIDKINELTTNYTNKKLQFQKQIKLLENEKQYLLDLQNLLIKRINDINNYFSI